MERRLGFDFAHVRVHAGAAAARSADGLGARAFTVGSHIVLGAGAGGDALLAHELAHVVQQGQGGEGGRPPGPEHERNADALVAGAGAAPLASAVGVARQPKTPLPALSAEELIERLVLSVRGFMTSPSGGEHLTFEGLGPALGPGYQTYAAIQIIDAQGNQVVTSLGQYLGGGGAHAEQRAIAALRNAIPKGTNLAGARIMLGVDQAPCSGCASAIEAFAQELGVAKLEVYVPTRPSLSKPSVDVSPKTGARTSMSRGWRAKLDSSKTFSGKPKPPTAAIPEPPSPEPPTTATKLAGTERAAATGEPGAGAPGHTPAQVETTVRVVSSTQQAGGMTVSEVEVTFGKGLAQVNDGAPTGAGLPQRMLLRVTQNADGTLAAAESLTGEPAAAAEAMARQLLAAGAKTAPGEAGGAAAGAAGGQTRAMSLLFRGVKWGGLAVFAVITGYQLIKATPEQRPKVLAEAGGGLAGGMAGTYLVCNLLLDIETAGWGLLICGFVAGGAGGYLGSKAAGEVYDEATMTDLDKALRGLEAAPLNVRRLFYTMVKNSTTGIPISADFVKRFIAIVPAGLSDADLYILAGQLQEVGTGGTLESVLDALRRAVQALPARTVQPPAEKGSIEIFLGPPVEPASGPSLFGPYHGGIDLTLRGGGKVIVFPGAKEPRIGIPPAVGPQPNLLELELFK